MQGFLKNKPSLEDVEAALQWSPAPIAVPGLPRLVEGARAARSWLARIAEVDPERGTAELRTLEALVSEGQRLPIAVPQLKVTASTRRLNWNTAHGHEPFSSVGGMPAED